jgi:hypothetical protein
MRDRLCGERNGARSFQRKTETSEHGQVGVKSSTLQATDVKRCESVASISVGSGEQQRNR